MSSETCKSSERKLCGNEQCEKCWNRSFASHEKSSLWAEDNVVPPYKVLLKSTKIFLLKCESCCHIYERRPSECVRGYGCPFCSNKKRCLDDCKFCFDHSFASHPRAKEWSKDNVETPREISLNCRKHFLFDCRTCGHRYNSSPSNINGSGADCPYCMNSKRCGKFECKICFEHSFASHPRADEWSSKNKEKAIEVAKGSAKKYWFRCKECRHRYQKVLFRFNAGEGCPFCSNYKRCGKRSCDFCFNHSFASNPMSEFWSEKNILKPIEVAIRSNKKYWFDCPGCGHERLSCPDQMHLKRACAYCSSKKKCGDKNCKFCFEGSFQSHFMMEFWSERNLDSPRDVAISSNKKYWFQCGDCDAEYKAALCNIVHNKTRCPNCKHKTEKKLFKWLRENYPHTKFQARFKWCKNIKCLPFDFCVGKTIIELDGPQHFRQIWKWKSPEEQQERDKFKEQKAIENGYKVIRLFQEDVWKDKIDWKSFLSEQLQ